MNAQYDLIVSLGGNCAAASQLRMRGLRRISLPFDWLYMEGPRTIKWLVHGFQTDFSDFCLKENLVEMSDDQPHIGGVAKYKYLDSLSGYGLIHHFHRDIREVRAYEESYATIKRRLDRLRDCLLKSESVLFIIATGFCFDLNLARALRETIKSKYPSLQVDFRVVQFGANLPDGVLGENGSDEDGVCWSRHRRTIGPYDLEFTSHEWAFLDELSLRGQSLHPITGVEKLRYKLWKSLSKHFFLGGAALKGMNFRLLRNFKGGN